MINVKITTSGVNLVSKYLKNLNKQTRFATMVAMNRTVYKVQQDVKKKMRGVFDRPTSYTINAIRYRKAKKTDLQAEIYVNDEAFKGVAPIKWLSPHIYGGQRREKRSEMHLRRRGLLPGNLLMVPGQSVRRNKFGNVTKGNINKILSNVRAQHDSQQNTPYGRRTSFFSGRVKGTRGIWERKGRHVQPVFIFVKPPRYKKIFDFYGIAEKSANKHWPGEMEKALDFALRTAR